MPLNPSHSKSGLDIPRQIFTQARRPPCRRSRGAKGLHGPLEEHSDEFLCMDEWRFSHSLVETGQTGRTERFAFPNVVSKKLYVWVSGLVLNISLVPSTIWHQTPTLLPFFLPAARSSVLQWKCLQNTLHITKENLYFSRHWNREAAGPRSNLFKPNCKSQTILLYYYNLSQRSLLFLWKGESKNGEKKCSLSG